MPSHIGSHSSVPWRSATPGLRQGNPPPLARDFFHREPAAQEVLDHVDVGGGVQDSGARSRTSPCPAKCDGQEQLIGQVLVHRARRARATPVTWAARDCPTRSAGTPRRSERGEHRRDLVRLAGGVDGVPGTVAVHRGARAGARRDRPRALSRRGEAPAWRSAAPGGRSSATISVRLNSSLRVLEHERRELLGGQDRRPHARPPPAG